MMKLLFSESTLLVNYKVSPLITIPDGMVCKTFEEATYAKRIAKGNILQGLVVNEWIKIWNSDLDRTYTADFEVYGEKAQHPEHAEVDIFVAIR